MRERYRTAVDAAAIFSETDLAGDITYVNEQFCTISGYSAQELLGQNHRILNSEQHPAEFFIDMWQSISRGQVWRGEICNRSKDGRLYWVESTIVPMFDAANQRVEKYVSIRFDVSEKRTLMQTLQCRAERDELTGLPNRFLLSERLEQAIAAVQRYHGTLAVGMLDLDGFKLINDRYVYRLAIENGRARNQRNFRLRLTATDGAVWLRLFASELAFSRAGLHSIVPYSH
ncbi:hypothetical protein H098_01875 [Pseudomonas fluorescens FH5]|nr:hypothetical protein H098_01875 [Pseudomonas fluorescens FH5]